MVWINALVESAGGTDPRGPRGAGKDVTPTVDSDAGREAARIIRDARPRRRPRLALSTADEEDARAAFQADTGGFMVNWPYV